MSLTKHTLKFFLGALLASLALSSAHAQSASGGLSGPHYCAECGIGVPIPDQGTREELNDPLMQVVINSQGATSVMLCNDSHCATYQRGLEGTWYGSDRQARVGSSGPFSGGASGGEMTPGFGGWQPPKFNTGCLSVYNDC